MSTIFKTRKSSLKTKFTIWVTIAVVLIVSLMGVYFDNFLKKSFLDDTHVRMRHGFERLAENLDSMERALKDGIAFATTDESLIASIELINNYQDKQNYNVYLIDEEKKLIANQLLNKVKFTFNNDITIYDKHNELIAFVSKSDKGYQLNYVSFKDGKTQLYSRYEHQQEYQPVKLILPRGIRYTHVYFYPVEKMREGSQSTHHRLDDWISIKSHLTIFAEERQTTIGHIEMSKILTTGYFQQLSGALNIKIQYSFNPGLDPQSVMLGEVINSAPLHIEQTELNYTAIMKQQSLEGPIYYTAHLDKITLNALLTQSRKQLLLYLFLMAIITMVLMRYFIRRKLDQPISALMEQIRKIENQDYSGSQVVSTGDELEKISTSINRLTSIVQERERSLEISMRNLEYRSNHDVLTELPNRRIFSQRLEHAIELAQRNKDKLAIFFLDLDQFKLINDTLGHDIGDELLIQVSNRLNKLVRKADTLARIGGDEFNILVENASDEEDLRIMVNKYLLAFVEPFNCKMHEIHVTASIGIALYPEDGNDSVTLIKHADLAMYSSKDRGRNCYTFFTDALSEIAEERAALINDLEKASSSCDQFEIYYQPKVRPHSYEVVSIEALLRWNHPVHGIISPHKFMSVAEETGLILPIGEWVLNKACLDFVGLLQSGIKLDHVSINVSNVQLNKIDMLELIQRVKENSGIEFTQIELEITESYVSPDIMHATDTLQSLRGIGVGLAIDDFGTGYSSMNYLQKLPVTRLKIDKTFIDGLDRSEASITIVKSIIGLAKGIELDITVEGVERQSQLKLLENEPCDELQGYYFSEPLPLENFIEFYNLAKKDSN